MRLFVVCFVVTFGACHAAEKTPVIPDDHIHGHNHESLPVERLAELKTNESTLNDVHRIFGLNEYKRRTYTKTLLPKVYKSKHYAVYRIVNYTAHSVERKDLGGVIESSWKESLDMTFFFDRNDVLLLHTIRHRHNDGNYKDHAGKWHNIVGNPDELWPGAVCDGIFHDIYETQRVQGSRYFSPVTTNKCTWLAKLRADVKNGVVN